MELLKRRKGKRPQCGVFSLIGPKGGSVLYCSNCLLKAICDAIKHLIHQLKILLIGDVGNDLLPGTGHPAGLGVGGSAAGEYQDADIGPFMVSKPRWKYFSVYCV